MEIFIDEIILRTVTEGDIEEIARMWDCPNEVTIEDAYQALKYMEQATYTPARSPSSARFHIQRAAIMPLLQLCRKSKRATLKKI